MSGSSRRLAWVAALVAVVGISASACGSSTTDTSSTGGGTSTTTAAATSGTTGGSSGTAVTEGTVAPGVADLVVISTPYGDALGTADGLVLYTWDSEADGTIACVGAECVEKWPPLLATEIGDIGDLSTDQVTLVERPDGSFQVAVDGRPLYHMAVDEPGEANCQGGEGWWIVNPDGTKNTNETPGAVATTTTAAAPGY